MNKVETLRWREGALEMIDQRRLPEHFEYVRCHSASEVACAIKDMVIRGAPAIGCAAAYGIALEALAHASSERFDAAMRAAFEVLAQSRPTAVNLFWALERMRGVWGDVKAQAAGAVAQRLLEEAHAVSREDVEANRAMGKLGAALIPDKARILTHCNAGALATAGHGTALGVIRSARDAGKRVSVIASETRPFLQGARLTAWEMVQEGIPVTLITDNMAGHLMSQGEVDLVIVGADRVAANGDVANKIGTYPLAVLARRHGLPFYVACPLATLDLNVASGREIPIEERAPEEVTGYRDMRWAAPGVKVRNPAFDVTPAELITALITERGVVEAPDREKIRRLYQGEATT